MLCSVESVSLSALPECPLLLLGLLAVDSRRADRGRVKEASRGDVYRPGPVGHNPPRAGGVREVRAECIIPVLLAKVATAPDAGAYPDADDGDDHNDEEDNPLVVALKPRKNECG